MENVKRNEKEFLEGGNKELCVKVIDSPPGTGKTSWAINKMNEDTEQHYIYITPFLSEIERVKNSCKGRKFTEPKVGKARNKLESLKRLVLKDKNIASTHALFTMCDQELITLLKSHNYTLVIDEVMETVKCADNIKNDDITVLFDQKLIKVSDTEYNKVEWIGSSDYNGRYNDIKMMCEAGTLFYIDNTLMVWAMPISGFRAFDEVYILTYQFQCQIQRYYYDYFGLEYDYYHIENKFRKYTLVKTKKEEINTYDIEFRRKAKELITIINNDKLNSIGEDYYSLSKSWFNKKDNVASIKQLKKNTYNFFFNIANTKSEVNMWTCFKENVKDLKGNGYSKGWIPLNSRATNNYANKQSLAYVCNRFLHPYVEKFFAIRDIKIDEEFYALSELLQWIWRSQIRNDKPITIYIPSKRMRKLLKKFLEV